MYLTVFSVFVCINQLFGNPIPNAFLHPVLDAIAAPVLQDLPGQYGMAFHGQFGQRFPPNNIPSEQMNSHDTPQQLITFQPIQKLKNSMKKHSPSNFNHRQNRNEVHHSKHPSISGLSYNDILIDKPNDFVKNIDDLANIPDPLQETNAGSINNLLNDTPEKMKIEDLHSFALDDGISEKKNNKSSFEMDFDKNFQSNKEDNSELNEMANKEIQMDPNFEQNNEENYSKQNSNDFFPMNSYRNMKKLPSKGKKQDEKVRNNLKSNDKIKKTVQATSFNETDSQSETENQNESENKNESINNSKEAEIFNEANASNEHITSNHLNQFNFTTQEISKLNSYNKDVLNVNSRKFKNNSESGNLKNSKINYKDRKGLEIKLNEKIEVNFNSKKEDGKELENKNLNDKLIPKIDLDKAKSRSKLSESSEKNTIKEDEFEDDIMMKDIEPNFYTKNHISPNLDEFPSYNQLMNSYDPIEMVEKEKFWNLDLDDIDPSKKIEADSYFNNKEKEETNVSSFEPVKDQNSFTFDSPESMPAKDKKENLKKKKSTTEAPATSMMPLKSEDLNEPVEAIEENLENNEKNGQDAADESEDSSEANQNIDGNSNNLLRNKENNKDLRNYHENKKSSKSSKQTSRPNKKRRN